MKRPLSLLLIFVFILTAALSSFAEVPSSASYINYSDYKISDDGRFRYSYEIESGEAYIEESLEENITVLELPQEVDGHPVKTITYVTVSSPSLTRIILPKSAKILNGSYCYSNKKSNVPLCTYDYNIGLEKISYCADNPEPDDKLITKELKCLIVPESVQSVELGGILSATAENIIVCNDITAAPHAFEKKDYHSVFDYDYPENFLNTKYYFAASGYNSDKYSFCNEPTYSELDGEAMYTIPSNISIYKKPGARGFEKFEEAGYTVKEYTDEWWNDIKEIESVTLSGTGLTENAEVTQKLSESELKWMDNEYSLNMKSGEKVKLSGTFAPSDAFDNRMFFVSLDEDYVKVDVDSGEVTALKKGTATVRCVAASGVFSDVVVSVDGGGMSEKASTTDTTNTNTSTKLTSSPAKDNAPTKDKTPDVKPVYIIVPACATIIAAAAVVVVKRKKK